MWRRRVARSVASLERAADRLLHQRIVLGRVTRAQKRARRVASDATQHVRRQASHVPRIMIEASAEMGQYPRIDAVSEGQHGGFYDLRLGVRKAFNQRFHAARVGHAGQRFEALEAVRRVAMR